MFNSNNRYGGNTGGGNTGSSSGSNNPSLGGISRSSTLNTNPPMNGYAAVASYNPSNSNNNNSNNTNNNNGLISLRTSSTSASGNTGSSMVTPSNLLSSNTNRNGGGGGGGTNPSVISSSSVPFSPINMNMATNTASNRSNPSSSASISSSGNLNTLRSNTNPSSSSSSSSASSLASTMSSSSSGGSGLPTGNDILNLLNSNRNTSSTSGSNAPTTGHSSSGGTLPPPGLGGMNPSSFRSSGNPGNHPTMNATSSIDDTTSNNITLSVDNYSLPSLLTLIRTNEKDIQSLVLGNDLTQVGLNLASTDPLHATFATPWAKDSTLATLTNPATVSLMGSNLYEPYYTLPSCYRLPQPPLKTGHLSKFDITTLMYIFYAMPRDILQAYAAQELYTREWRYHRDHHVWYKVTDNTTPNNNRTPLSYVYFDINAWERRPYTGNANSLATGFLSEDECRVKVIPSTATVPGTPTVTTNQGSASLGGM